MGAAKTHPPLADRFWGPMGQVELPVRIVSLVFVAVAIAALSFTQLGFWPVGIIEGKPVYLMLILAPLMMGALLFGPFTGALLGLFAGAVVFAHASFLALDFYEIYFMTPLNTFLLLTVLGAAAGFAFSLVARRCSQMRTALAWDALACVGLSFAASVLFALNTVLSYGGLEYFDIIRDYLLMGPLGLAAQALIDAALMIVLCWTAAAALGHAAKRGRDRALLLVFRNWMLLISAIVFMATSAVVFSVATVQSQNEATDSMMSEVDYLQHQISRQASPDYEALLDGFTVALDGYVVITDENAVILASDDADRYPVGDSFVELLDYGDGASSYEDGEIEAGALLGAIAEMGEGATLQATGENGAQSMDFAYVVAASFDGGYVAMVQSPQMVYTNRFGTMAAITLLAILLIAAIAIVATVLLNRVVVRRVDETNQSLLKITDGNLAERVNINDTREFSSLSAGINSTVAALKDTIDEVKQKNAQELATAKAIQESALPREFPPFPEIETFDIYASMKTAKEVGGDFYDFFLIGEGDERLGFVMADVSGKGIPAALFMMTAKTQIQSYMEAGLPLGEAIDAANHQLCIGNDAGMFVTMFACVLEYRTGKLTYVNGGHNPPLLLHDGEWSWMRDVSGMPLGLFDGIPYEPFERQLEAGDMLYLYTDGVTEAMDGNDELFGEERLLDTLKAYADLNPRSVCVGVRRAITDFTLDVEQSDDITMLGLKYGVPPEKKAVMVLRADVEQLVHVFNFIHEELRRRGAPKSVWNPLDIAAEELFVNVCHYAYPDATPERSGEVRIGFEYEATPPSLTVTISDDGIPYNPLEKPDAVTPDDIMAMPIGGLGILMAKRSVDDMTYERVGDTNILTFVKRW